MQREDIKPHSGKTKLSKGFETLISQGGRDREGNNFDVVVIGSGYGGSIAAAELAATKTIDGKPLSVCVLERGREFLAGSFPSFTEDLAREVRYSTPNGSESMGELEGLFDIRMGSDISVVLANGLGGGSLINAGVMKKPIDGVFDQCWPDELRDSDELERLYDEASVMLGATLQSTPTRSKVSNTIELHDLQDSVKKHSSVKQLASDRNFESAPVTIAMSDRPNWANIDLKKCTLCGDCATGCNYGAKDSLDVNLLVVAKHNGAELYTGATALKFKKSGGESVWELQVTFTDRALRKKLLNPLTIRTDKIVLAAGALGSTELLMRCRDEEKINFSEKLGKHFSSNGDMLFTAYGQRQESNSIANETTPVEERLVGPTITGLIDLRESKGTVIEEMAVPAPLGRLFKELFTTSYSIHSFQKWDIQNHKPGSVKGDPLSIDEKKLKHTSLFAGMGIDGASGQFKSAANQSMYVEGTIKIHWPELKDHVVFERQLSDLKELSNRSKLGGTVMPNPFWQLFPPKLMFLMEEKKGPPLTVHPLGGCPMGSNMHEGVVDHCGRVFDPFSKDQSNPTHEGLVVLDGSIMPTALGINPALTIATVALRAVRRLIEIWELEPVNNSPTKNAARAIFPRDIESPLTPSPTTLGVSERLVGQVDLDIGVNKKKPVVVELTIQTKPKSVSEIIGGDRLNDRKSRTLILKTSKRVLGKTRSSKVRVFEVKPWEKLRQQDRTTNHFERDCDREAIFVGSLSGEMTVFGREKSNVVTRMFRGLHAWFLNRGLRDIVQSLCRKPYEKKYKSRLNPFPPATKAGEIRTLTYDLKVVDVFINNNLGNIQDFQIKGTKYFTYSRRCNPWRQLAEVHMENFLGKLTRNKVKPLLHLDTHYLARIGVPLIQIKNQENQVRALMDIASLANYLVRMLIHIHFWSFRKPDTPEPRKFERFAGKVRGLPFPEITHIKTGKVPHDAPPELKEVKVRLTRYKYDKPEKPPILMIHGYSASSTSFAHHAVENGLARYFYEDKRDVWLIDLRTSSAFEVSAKYPWKFEDVAEEDIPLAILHIFNSSDQQKIDILAQCMGAVMLGMVLLGSSKNGREDNFYRDKINKIVFSQATPALSLTPNNALRTLAANYFKELFPRDYQFRPVGELTATGALLDRLLYTLPYPKEEFDRTNPIWPPTKRVTFAQTRHRMDALYGRDFNLAPITDHTLDYIDDLFGPLNIETVTQVMHFSASQSITTHEGKNVYLTRNKLKKQWPWPTYGIHSKNNGLIDYSTRARTTEIFEGIYKNSALIGENDDSELVWGHQDTLVGEDAHRVIYPKIKDFFDRKDTVNTDSPPHSFLIEPPYVGPILVKDIQDEASSGRMRVMVGTNDVNGTRPYVFFLPVCKFGQSFVVAGNDVKTQQNTVSKYVDYFFDGRSILVECDNEEHPRWIVANIDEKILLPDVENDGVLIFLVYDDYPLGSGLNIESSLIDLNMLPSSIATKPVEGHEEIDIDNRPAESISSLAKKLEPEIDKLDISVLSSLRAAAQTGGHDGIDYKKFLAEFILDEFSSPGEKPTKQHRRSLIEYQRYKKDDAAPLVFALGSCQYPNGILDREPAYQSYRALNETLECADSNILRPEFLILAGDQVYVDPTAGFMDPRTAYDRYTLPYRRLYRNRNVRSVLKKIPMYACIDDHEIIDNWEPSIDANAESRKREGVKSFLQHQRGLFSGQQDPLQAAKLWYTFTHNDYPFFVMDTRTERSPRIADTALAKGVAIMSPNQMEEIEKWITSHDSRPKYLVSGSMLLPRHRPSHGDVNDLESAARSDGWDGYPQSLEYILTVILENEVENAIFLSGDEHLASYSTIKLSNKSGNRATLYSIHCPGLYTPFPFANSKKEDLISNESFEFEYNYGGNEDTCVCIVETQHSIPNESLAVGPVNVREISGVTLVST